MTKRTSKYLNKNIFRTIALLLCFVLMVGMANWTVIIKSLPDTVANAASYIMGKQGAKSSNFVPLDYTVTLDYQGGERVDGDKTLTSDSLEIKSNNETYITPPEKKGYAFYGFFSETNAKGVKYFDAKGEMPKNIVFDVDTPRTLYAAWVKLSSGEITTNDGVIKIKEKDGDKHTKQSDIGLDISRLRELRYTQIQVNLKINIRVESEGAGRDIWLDIGQTPNYKNVWNKSDTYFGNTAWEDFYYSIALDIEEFNNSSQFRLGFSQSSKKALTTESWYFNESKAYFTAIEQSPEKPLTVTTRELNTTSYIIPDNKDYDVTKSLKEEHPLESNYVSYSLRYNGGELLDDGNGNYGYIADENFNGEQNPGIQVLLKYNFNHTEKINGTEWNIGYDNHSGAVNGVNGIGVVGSGALLVQKSADGENWTWENPYNNNSTQSFHTSDLINNYSPALYDGQEHTGMKIAPVEKRDENGNIVYKTDENGESEIDYIKKDEKMAHQESYSKTDGYLPIYTPKGEALKAGVYIRVCFAYELSYYDYKSGWDEFWDGFIDETKVWHYKNVIEETTFFISNSKAEILFQNMDFSAAESTEESTENSRSELVRQFGSVNDGDAVNEGFKVNYNGNSSYKVRYSKNGSGLNDEINDSVYDSRVFMAPGRYEFEVTPKIGETKKTTVYINDRGLAQNLNYYFGGNLIDNDSKRLFSQMDDVPVYKAGQVKWHTNEVDADHMPIAGRIGLYQETISKAAFESKYGHDEDKTFMAQFNSSNFRLPSRVEVDSNYKIVPNDGYTSYRVKVEKGYEPKEGDGFEAYPKPQEIGGKTYIGTVYGTLEMDDGRTIVGTIDGYDIYKIVASKLNDSKGEVRGAAFTQPGNYLAEFANNPKYFNSEEQVSGDVFTFIFQFRVTEEDFLPELNKSNLSANIGFSDYESKYYGVEIPNRSTNKIVTFAYFDEAEAYNTAYDYVRSFVKKVDGGYEFNGKRFSDQNDVIAEVYSYIEAEEIVRIKYFDGSDKSSYLSYGGDPNTILTTDKLAYDVVVFDSGFNSHTNAAGIPFLNNRVFSYVDDKGNMINGENAVKFIQISDYESKSVEIFDKDNKSYGLIPYGAEVQGYLQAKNAPSGKYKIVETNDCGQVEYEGIYLRKGNNTTSIDIKRVYNSVTMSHELNQNTANVSYTVNSIVLTSATNELDPYGIVKITNTAGYKKVYQLDEIENIKIDAQGEWTITTVDRLGNSVDFYVNIYTPSLVSKLTLMNNGEVYSTAYVSGGERVYLDTLPAPDANYEFIGWSDGQGNIYNGNFLCSFKQDTVLTAEYRFISTRVSIYDGVLIGEPIITKPSEKLLLPSDLSRAGLEFYGYKYLSNEEERFCIGQLNSVPNVSELRLDAVYLDRSSGLTVANGQVLTPRTKPGCKFYGWGTADRGENAKIFTDGTAEFSSSENLTVYALYIADEGNAPIIGGAFANNNTVHKVLNGIGREIVLSIKNGNMFFVLAFLCLFACVAMYLRKKKTLPRLKFTAFSAAKTNTDFQIPSVSNIEVQRAMPVNAVNRRVIEKLPKSGIHIQRPKMKWRVVFANAICLMLVIVLGSFATDKFLYSAGTSVRIHEQEKKIERQFEEYENEILAQNDAKREHEILRNEYTAQVQAIETLTEDGSAQEDEFSIELDFLYNMIVLDLNIKGYEAFDAIVTKTNGDQIKGIGYTDYTYIETREKLEYYKAGFISYLDEAPLTPDDISAGVKIEELVDEDDEEQEEPYYAFELINNEKTWTDHYIAFEKYCKYTIENHNISYCAVEDDPSLYDVGIGYLYNYDLGRAVYDPDLGKEFDKSAYTITAGLDYEKLIETYRTIIDRQSKNGITVDSVRFTAIDVSAINEYVLHGQNEEFLGVSSEQISFIESQVDNSSFYYIDGVTGQISVLNIPEIPPEDNSATIWNIINAVISAAMFVGGIVLICTGIGAPFGSALAIGGVIGFAAQYFQDEIGQLVNNLIGVEGAQLVGGSFSVVMGKVTISIGSKIIGKGGAWGTVGGSICILIGALLSVFGANEIIDYAFDFNIIKELPFMSDSLYNNLYRALNYAATAITIVYSTLTKYYQLADKSNLRKRVEYKKAKALKKAVTKKQRVVEEIVKNNRYPKPGNRTWKTVSTMDNFNPVGDGITREQLMANRGKAYIVNRKDPSIFVEIEDGLIKFDSKMLNKYAYLDFPKNTYFPKKRKMNVFDQYYAKKLNLNPDMIPNEIKKFMGNKKITWRAIRDFRSKNNYVWHEDITGRVMLIPKAIHNIGKGFSGIPHLGVVAVSNKNVHAMQVFNMLMK